MISVIMPAYKAKYLREAIDSVLAQTYTDFEFIIVNDCSPEDLTSIVQSYSDPRIRYYINEQNLGRTDIVANWNKCLSYARGEFFALICDDDLYAPTFLEEMMALTVRFPECNVFRAAGCFIDKNNEVTSYFSASPEWESAEQYLWQFLEKRRYQTISEWFYRRQPIVDMGGYISLPLAWFSDSLSCITFAVSGGIASSYKHLVKFRMSGENISGSPTTSVLKKAEASVIFAQKVRELIEREGYNKRMYQSLNRLMRHHRMVYLKSCKIFDYFRFVFHAKEYGINMEMCLYALCSRIKQLVIWVFHNLKAV